MGILRHAVFGDEAISVEMANLEDSAEPRLDSKIRMSSLKDGGRSAELELLKPKKQSSRCNPVRPRQTGSDISSGSVKIRGETHPTAMERKRR